MDWWCEILYFRYNDNARTINVLVCATEDIRHLILDAVELKYKKEGYTLVKVDVIGRVNNVAVAEHKNDNY
ncbi:MAG: hypothetical protein GXO43_06125 [Crenarchaeota archaeon]|nr:hypothetical protein [Thermoproteota archaeon]